MKFSEFKQSSTAVSTKYRAVCKSKGGHWKGTWRKKYSEATTDGNHHRNAPGGKNKRHRIKIEMEQRSEAFLT